ncbi:MAG: glycosyltransferase [Deltaproteobacteria bacterium]|nr:glycosyltransferase [Deltaproteobacteria bacterium]
MRDAAIVLLTLNEIEGLRAVWSQVPVKEFKEVFAVDGGSTDGTQEFLREHGAGVVVQPIRGRGVAFRCAADASSAERLIFYSPDGNEDPADIVRLDDALVAGADLAIARRFGPGAVNEEDGETIRLRARVNDTLSQLANRLFHDGPRVYDTINGFRALRRSALLELDTTVKRFPIEYQITIRAMQRGWTIAEVPTREGQRIGGERKAASWPVGLDHLKVLLTELPRSRLFGA